MPLWMMWSQSSNAFDQAFDQTCRSDDALPLEIFVRLLVVHVAARVLKLLVNLRVEAALAPVLHALPQRHCVVNFRHLVEVFVVGNAKCTHAVLVPPLLEVLLKRTPAPVAVVATDFTLELLVEAVQLVEPVGDGLAVPAQRQLERVVHICVLLILVLGGQLRLRLLLLSLHLLVGLRLFLLYPALCVSQHLAQQLRQLLRTSLQQRNLECALLQLLNVFLAALRTWRNHPLGKQLLVELLQWGALGEEQALGALLGCAAAFEAQGLQRLLQPVSTNGLQLL
mmetsp:Transcript_40482/g.89950  ORF Transcript_40482/g.89950 Transcript_40482/m.89950 type:complete len:282 (+) Transcript_40482:630-1475(+)